MKHVFVSQVSIIAKMRFLKFFLYNIVIRLTYCGVLQRYTTTAENERLNEINIKRQVHLKRQHIGYGQIYCNTLLQPCLNKKSKLRYTVKRFFYTKRVQKYVCPKLI